MSADETRTELLQAAMKVVLEKGYAGTRVSEIAREANVTTGAIYNHFDSKTELLIAAITEQSPSAISDLLGSGESPDVLDAFAQIGRRLPEGRVLGPTLLELIVTSTRDPGVAAVVGEVFAAEERSTTDLIRVAQDAGEVDPSLDAEALVRFTTMVALGAIAVTSLGLEPIDEDAWAAVIDRMLTAARPTSTASTATPQGDQK
ncbi:MAG: TetR/AcrR family transcriptional regulator [Microthrixaceae bacterium]